MTRYENPQEQPGYPWNATSGERVADSDLYSDFDLNPIVSDEIPSQTPQILDAPIDLLNAPREQVRAYYHQLLEDGKNSSE